MVFPGLWPAAVTPFDAEGGVDYGSVLKLLAYFRDAGCSGAVLAGTTGEGASLSAIEKRDLIRFAVERGDGFPLVLGVASNSLHEAKWLVGQAGKAGAAGVLVSPPSFFRQAGQEEILAWMLEVIEVATCPVVLYHFPQVFGVGFELETLGWLIDHENVIGVKDSSGDKANLGAFREVVPLEKVLMTGEELLLVEALESGWSGSISGTSNVLAPWTREIVKAWHQDAQDQAMAKFEMILPVLEEMKGLAFPGAMKAVLAEWGVIERADVRLPLANGSAEPLATTLRERLGMR